MRALVTLGSTGGGNAGSTLEGAILDRTRPIVSGLGLRDGAVDCRLEPRGSDLHVHLDLPITVGPGLQQALAVRVLDAVRANERTIGVVDVSIHGPR